MLEKYCFKNEFKKNLLRTTFFPGVYAGLHFRKASLNPDVKHGAVKGIVFQIQMARILGKYNRTSKYCHHQGSFHHWWMCKTSDRNEALWRPIISFIDTISHWLWLKQGSWRHIFSYISFPHNAADQNTNTRRNTNTNSNANSNTKDDRERTRREPNYNPWVTPGNPGTQCGLYCFEPGLNHRHLNELDCPQLNWITRICSPKKFLFRLTFPLPCWQFTQTY